MVQLLKIFLNPFYRFTSQVSLRSARILTVICFLSLWADLALIVVNDRIATIQFSQSQLRILWVHVFLNFIFYILARTKYFSTVCLAYDLTVKISICFFCIASPSNLTLSGGLIWFPIASLTTSLVLPTFALYISTFVSFLCFAVIAFFVVPQYGPTIVLNFINFITISTMILISSLLREDSEKKLDEERASTLFSAKSSSLAAAVSGIAHEINNPLTILNGRLVNLSHKIDLGLFDGEKIKSEIEKVLQSSQRITNVIKSMNQLSQKVDAGVFLEIDLFSMINEIINLYLIRAQDNFIEFGIEWKVQNSKIDCIPSEIFQVLNILVSNSFDAVIERDNRWIKILVSGDEENMKISLIDSGLGLSEKVQERLMEPFFTTKTVNKGMGLSLSIAKTLVARHNGSLSYDKNSSNTKFDLVLPRVHLES